MFTVKKYVSIVLALLLLLAFTNAATANGLATMQDRSIVSTYQETQLNPSLADEAKIKATIDAYFHLRYEGQKLLKAQDFSTLLADVTQPWIQKEKDKREIELYTASVYRLNYVTYKYFLDYDSLEIKGDKAVAQLRESHEVVFAAIAPEVSKLANLKHVITLNKTGKGWNIVIDEYKDELTQLMANETKDNLMERVRLNHEDELQRAAKFAVSKTENALVTPNSGTWHSYNGTAAKNYADTWWNSRNPAYYNFDCCGGDCTNFVSQVIYAGAPQMDSTGSYQWYYYNVNSRSPSWTDVSQLYTYLVNNTWTGPYGSNASQCDMVPGDVIQLSNGSSWFHSLTVVSSGSLPTRCYDSSTITVDTHTTDRYHYPLSNYSAYTKRFIHIGGWYD